MVPYPAFTFCGICSLSYRYLASSLPVVSYTLFDTFYLTNFHSPTPAFFFYISLLFYFLLAPLLNCTSTASQGDEGSNTLGARRKGKRILEDHKSFSKLDPEPRGPLFCEGEEALQVEEEKGDFLRLPSVFVPRFFLSAAMSRETERGALVDAPRRGLTARWIVSPLPRERSGGRGGGVPAIGGADSSTREAHAALNLAPARF